MTYLVQRNEEDTYQSPCFETETEAEAYRLHLSRLSVPVPATVMEGEEPATHRVADGLMTRLDSSTGVAVVIAVPDPQPGDGYDDYDLALQARVEALSQQSVHAAAESGNVGVDSTGLVVVLSPGNSETPWHVSLRMEERNAAVFSVDMDDSVMTAPGMFPDPIHGYAVWVADGGRVAMAFDDTEGDGVNARVITDFDGHLPEIDSDHVYADDVADLAQLIADVAIGWRE